MLESIEWKGTHMDLIFVGVFAAYCRRVRNIERPLFDIYGCAFVLVKYNREKIKKNFNVEEYNIFVILP